MVPVTKLNLFLSVIILTNNVIIEIFQYSEGTIFCLQKYFSVSCNNCIAGNIYRNMYTVVYKELSNYSVTYFLYTFYELSLF